MMTSRHPNVLWIFCDELRTDALGCYGNDYAKIRTPNIDQIAASGLRFEQCFVTSPVCVSSRTSMLTGLYPEQTGVYHNEGSWPHFTLDELPVTFPEVFAAHGYVTADFGKMHLPRQFNPWMFHDSTGSAMTDPFGEIDRAALDLVRTPGAKFVVGGRFPAGRFYRPQAVTDNTLAWLETTAEPFLARVSYLQPHTPVIPPAPFDALYEHERFPDAPDMRGNFSTFELRFAEINGGAEMPASDFFRAQVHYHGLVAWIDTQVGRLLDHLRERGLLNRTLIVFSADHGALLGEAGWFGKQIFAPGSQRVPFLLSLPSALPRGDVRTDICEGLDLARTLLSIAGIETPAQFQGRDLLSAPAPEAAYSTIGYGFATSKAFPNLGLGEYVGGHGWPRRACVRTAGYRLDKNVRIDGHTPVTGEQDIFLADVVADPDERWNLAGDPAARDTVARLSALIDAHIAGSVEPSEESVRPPDRAQPRQTAAVQRDG